MDGFGSESLRRLHSRCWPVLRSSESFTRTGEGASKLVHSPTCSQDASLFWHEAPAWGGLSVVTTRQLASLRVCHSRGSKMEASIFSYYLTLEVTHQNNFFKVLLATQVISIHCRRGVNQGADIRRWSITGAISEAGCHRYFLLLK